jgi:hypothetical protein
MTTAKDVLQRAAREIGYTESPPNSNLNKFGAWYGINEVPWCAIFVSYCFYDARLPLEINTPKGFSYCPEGLEWFEAKGQFFKTPQVGDLAFFDWDGDGMTEHVGLVESVNDDGTVTCIEGNTGSEINANGGQVKRSDRSLEDILGFGRPAYTEESSPQPELGYPVWPGRYITLTSPLMSGNDVLTWQMRMISRGWEFGTTGSTGKGDDGIFNKRCHEVLLKFQKQKGLKSDGLLGPMSWNAAWEAPIT